MLTICLLLLTGLLVIAAVVAQSLHTDRARLARETARHRTITRYRPDTQTLLERVWAFQERHGGELAWLAFLYCVYQFFRA